MKTLLSAVVIALALAALYLYQGNGVPVASTAPVAASAPLTAIAESGDFAVRLTETGRINARQSVTLASELPSNEAKLVYLAQEGSRVEPGQVVARFDPQPFAQEIRKLEADFADVRAAREQLRREFRIEIEQEKENLQNLDYQIRSGELQLNDLKHGEGRLRTAQLENESESARIKQLRADRELGSLKQMLGKGFAKPEEVDLAREQLAEAKANHKLGQDRLDLYVKVQLPNEIKRRELELGQIRRSLAGATRTAELKRLYNDGRLRRADAKISEIEQALSAAKSRLEKTAIVAPVSGLVVFKPVNFQGEQRKAQVGDSVWNRHGFIVIPDMSSLVVELKIPETTIGRITVGQPVSVVPDAFPDITLAGRIASVGSVAEEADGFYGGRVFSVVSHITDADERLRPGMSATTRILVAEHRDVIRIPLQSVHYDNHDTVAWVKQGGDFVMRSIKIIDSDHHHAAVTAGISAGEQLALTAPDKK